MKTENSISYDLTFQEALLRFTNAQLEPGSNPNESSATLEQEQEQQAAYKLLCDAIDYYADRFAQMQNTALKNKAA